MPALLDRVTGMETTSDHRAALREAQTLDSLVFLVPIQTKVILKRLWWFLTCHQCGELQFVQAKCYLVRVLIIFQVYGSSIGKNSAYPQNFLVFENAEVYRNWQGVSQ